MCVIPIRQTFVSHGNRPAGTLGDILARHFNMDTAAKASLGAVHSKEAAHFG